MKDAEGERISQATFSSRYLPPSPLPPCILARSTLRPFCGFSKNPSSSSSRREEGRAPLEFRDFSRKGSYPGRRRAQSYTLPLLAIRNVPSYCAPRAAAGEERRREKY